MESFTQLQAWQSGIRLLKEIYTLTEKFPAAERYELTKQMRRAAMSVLANIAEGFSKRSAPDKANKYTIARSECSEILAFLYGAAAVGFISDSRGKHALSLAEETGKLLSGLIQAQLAKQISQVPYAQRPIP